jgi:effector-binding domain-containing protein
MYEVVPRQIPEQPTLVVTGKLEVAEIPPFLQSAYSKVATHLTLVGSEMAGMPFARFRWVDSDRIEVEAGFPVASPLEGQGDVVASTLPGGPVAVVVHFGPYEELGAAYDAIETWITERGAYADGPAWEVYFTDPAEQPDPKTWKTEVVQPYSVL